MKSIIKIILIFAVIFFSFSVVANAEPDYSKIEGANFFNDTVSNILNGDFTLSPKEILTQIYKLFFSELYELKGILISIFTIAFVCGVINASSSQNSVSTVAFFVCFSIMTIACAKLVVLGVGYGCDIINEMSDFITKLAPMLSILLVSSGYSVSAGAFYPVFSVSVYVILKIIEKVIIPAIYIGCVTGIVKNITTQTQLNNFNKLIKSFSKWLLTALLTVFSGINAIYGFCTPTLDSVGMKTAKFAIGSMVPVVGGFLSESIETVIGGTRLLKNAVGTAAIVHLIIICALPIIKICAMMIMLRILASFIEPFSDSRFSDMLIEVSDALTTVFAVVIIITVFFILSIAIIIGATNVTI